MNNVSSGNDYAQLLIDEILKDSYYSPFDSRLLDIWFEEITIFANITWSEYIIGKRDMYEFNENEFEQTLDKAGIKYVEELLDGLIDKGMVEVGIGKEGDILYKVTDEGIKHIK